MNNRNQASALLKPALVIATMLVAASANAGCATADVHTPGGSTTVIHHDASPGFTESRVIRYRDGHKVITRDGNNTDITVQRSTAGGAFGGHNRFDRAPGDGRFRTTEPADTRESFRQRMLERLRQHPDP
ncbi:hypothetical protein TVNIR_2078 [Thioalkalivibrio nitratireducens DSM 14787]|uniref:Lipoprotein n=1 Tax=Thioalkalivibrio nitratireducens (strain DSM 14787 / UNIQEM 213 / ALEN2) TaxID=1255043 RepID=L0DXG6_THIND|nr:hypothetical protein [Thioalkalivibrio nitratireducens]AGA33738.1 hypothetical protein TVNIR_2078 [Thioalkalivibrio nitratireducens DSM 14787]